jgi:hypothetical protein
MSSLSITERALSTFVSKSTPTLSTLQSVQIAVVILATLLLLLVQGMKAVFDTEAEKAEAKKVALRKETAAEMTVLREQVIFLEATTSSQLQEALAEIKQLKEYVLLHQKVEDTRYRRNNAHSRDAAFAVTLACPVTTGREARARIAGERKLVEQQSAVWAPRPIALGQAHVYRVQLLNADFEEAELNLGEAAMKALHG